MKLPTMTFCILHLLDNTVNLTLKYNQTQPQKHGCCSANTWPNYHNFLCNTAYQIKALDIGDDLKGAVAARLPLCNGAVAAHNDALEVVRPWRQVHMQRPVVALRPVHRCKWCLELYRHCGIKCAAWAPGPHTATDCCPRTKSG